MLCWSGLPNRSPPSPRSATATRADHLPGQSITFFLPPIPSAPLPDLLTENPLYKRHRDPWAHEAWLMQQRLHWLPEEVRLADDVRDWQRNLSEAERNLLTQSFRLFTQANVEGNNCYMKSYSQVFKATEILMILAAFSNTETIHIAACSHRLDTIGMPELEYQAFFRYEEVKDKFDFMQTFRIVSSHEITKTLAEGLQLQKNPQIWIAQLQQDITGICATIVDHEDAFIGLARLYHPASNSLPWLDDMLTPWSAT